MRLILDRLQKAGTTGMEFAANRSGIRISLQ